MISYKLFVLEGASYGLPNCVHLLKSLLGGDWLARRDHIAP